VLQADVSAAASTPRDQVCGCSFMICSELPSHLSVSGQSSRQVATLP